MDNKRKTFVIIDANAFVHKSFHGYTPRLDTKGKDQRVLHGLMAVLNTLMFHIDEINYLYLVFDPPDSSLFRKSLYPAYKANRPPNDPDLMRQKEMAQKILIEHIGIPSISVPGYEADDIIGSLACHAKQEHRVIVVSPDKDLAQLVDDHVYILRPFKNKENKGYKMLNKESIKEITGVHPHQIPDWLALVGDVSDNLPGLDKIGEKKAALILSQYMSIEHLIAFQGQIENKIVQKQVQESQEILKLVRMLATVVCDLPVASLAKVALERSLQIQSHQDYKKKLMLVQNYFSLPDHYMQIFHDDEHK